MTRKAAIGLLACSLPWVTWLASLLTYRAKITDWLNLQPEADYIVHPQLGGQPGTGAPLNNALVVGLHFELHKEFN